jgi:hypothetical protein
MLVGRLDTFRVADYERACHVDVSDGLFAAWDGQLAIFAHMVHVLD